MQRVAFIDAGGARRMRLTVFTNYALRTLMYAAMHDNRLCRCREIADVFGISKAHLNKCIHQLGQWGFLENIRGRSGGFQLARPASENKVGEVARLTEDTLELVECFNPETNTCRLMRLCRLSKTFQRARGSFMDELDRISIADVVSNGAALRRLLNERRPEQH
jgi:Rrf2 family transcriptional regulator, nitric oxide-sensitive transcriptional repressor